MLRLRLVIAVALTIGAGTKQTQAFVVAPRQRLFPSCARGCSSVPVPLRDGDGSAWSHGRERRGNGDALSPSGRSNSGNASVSMRAGRGRAGRGRRVEIEGAGGEKRRVQRRSRKPDLRSMRRVGLQAAAAVAVQQEQGVDVDVGEEAQEAEDALEQSLERSLAERFQAAEGLTEKQMMEEESTGTVLDKYTKIYIPADGIVIKKTYGFWTWQVFGFIFVQHFVRNIIRKGGSLKKTSMDELNWDHIVTEPEHLLELKAYCCEECGYTLFPARGRHEVFFDEVEDFKCPECEAPRSAFYDANDKDDPHNQKRNEELEAKAAAARADGKGAGAGDDNEGGVVTSSAAGAQSSVAAKSPSASTTTAPASPPASANSASKPAPPESKAGDTSPPPDSKRTDGDEDDNADDLLDF